MDKGITKVIAFLTVQFFVPRAYARWVITPATRIVFQDGKDGPCEYSEVDDTTPTCSTGWVTITTIDGAAQTLSNVPECSSFKRYTDFVCYRDRSTEGIKEELCKSRRYFYNMKTECENRWLPWEGCDASCDGGTDRRYRFTTTNSVSMQERTCNTQSCPNWNRWITNDQSCDSSCTKMWSRECVYRGDVIDPSRCPTDYSSISGNLTHQAYPCLDQRCRFKDDKDILRPEDKDVNIPPVNPVATLSSMILSSTTTNPLIISSTENEKRDEFSIDFDSPVQYEGRVVFASSTFWVGFSVGVATVFFLMVLVFILFSNSKKGKTTVAAVKSVMSEQNYYFEKNGKISRSPSALTQTSIVKHQMNRSGSSKLDTRRREPSIQSYPSYKKEDYKSYPSSVAGSISGSSRYQDTWKGIDPIEYGTYYTPVGETKRFNKEKSLPIDQFYVAMPSSQHSSPASGYSSGSDDESYDRFHDGEHSPRVHRRNDGAFYYSKYARSTPRPRLYEPSDHYDDTYLRKYQKSPERRKPQKAESSTYKQRRQSADSRSSRSPTSNRRYKHRPDLRSNPIYSGHDDPRYAKPTKRRAREAQREQARLDDDMMMTKSETLRYGKSSVDISLPIPVPTSNNYPQGPPPPFRKESHINQPIPTTSPTSPEGPYSTVPGTASADDDDDGFTFPTLPPFVEEKKEFIETFKSNYPDIADPNKERFSSHEHRSKN